VFASTFLTGHADVLGLQLKSSSAAFGCKVHTYLSPVLSSDVLALISQGVQILGNFPTAENRT
jgi:hypothetical protein